MRGKLYSVVRMRNIWQSGNHVSRRTIDIIISMRRTSNEFDANIMIRASSKMYTN